MKYDYRATTADGVESRGGIEAESADAAAQALRSRGLRVLAIEPAAGFLDRFDALGSEGAHTLAEHASGAAAAGIALGPGFRALGAETGGALGRVLARVADALDAGKPLETALDEQGRLVPGLLRAATKVGARTGELADALARYVRLSSFAIELNRTIRIRMAYPAFSILMAVSLAVFVSAALSSTNFGIIELFNDFGVETPAVVVAFAGMGRVVGAFSPIFLLLLIGLTAFLAFARLFLSAARRRSLATAVPVLGSAWKFTSLAEFCQMLAMLIECGVPLPEALRVIGEGPPDAVLKGVCNTMVVDLERGLPLDVVLARHSYFPVGLGRLLAWGESAGSIPDALRAVASMYEARARAQASFASTFFGVLAVLIILWGVALLIGSVVFPLISLISRLSG